MEIKLYYRNLDPTEGLREKVNQKLSQITCRLSAVTDIRLDLAS